MKNVSQGLLNQLFIIAMLLTIIPVSEALPVIYDSGNTQPISGYLPQRFEQENTKQSRQSVLLNTKIIGLCFANHNTFPVAGGSNGQPQSITLFATATFSSGF